MANLLDKIVGILSPDAGLRRHRSRQLLQRAYEGASKKDGWSPRRPGASANTDHAADASTLRVRARALVQNSPYIVRGLDSLVSYTIGTGIAPRSLAKNAAVIDALHAQWAKKCDADGRLDLFGMQAAADLAMEADGEVLIRLRFRRPSDGLAVPLQLQLLEIDWLDSSKRGTAGPNTIVNGIEYDPIGRIAAYWLWDQHPGEQLSVFQRRSTSSPVPASSIIHLYNPKRPGQGRGFTRLAPVIARVRDLTLYEDAELQRKNLETRLCVIATGDVSTMAQSESDSLGEVRSSGDLGTLASGSILQVPSGVNLEVVEPKAAPGYVDYVKFNLHIIAAGMGVTYQMLTGDAAEGNFSSERSNRLNLKKSVEQTQWLTLIPRMCEPIWVAFIDAAVMAGKLPRADYSADWSTPKWDYVNPEQDVKADLAEISGGLSTISEKLRQRGYKPALVFAELKSDFEQLRKDGVLDILLQLQTNQAPQVDAKPAADAAARSFQDLLTQSKSQHDATQAALALLQGQFGQEKFRQDMSAMLQATRAADTKPIENHIHLAPTGPIELRAEISTPPAQVTVHNQVHPAPVEVRNEVTVPAPSITVHNDVQPAQVDVSVRATMPERVSETTVQRDGAKNIIKSTTVERDL